MKRRIVILLAAAMAAAGAWADTEVIVDGIKWGYTVSNGKATIVSAKIATVPNSGLGAIPSTLGGYPVTRIGYEAFKYCGEKDFLTSVTIPNGVTSIGLEAFYNCSSLTSVTIPKSMTSIGSSAFYNCSKLKSVYITDIRTWLGISFGDTQANPRYYARNLYLNGSLLKGSLTIPDGVTNIPAFTFRDCSGLTSVTIPNSVTNIGYHAFFGCSGLMSFSVASDNLYYKSVSGLLLTKDGKTLICGINGNVTIPDGVTSIGSDAFCDCSGLTSVIIPNSVTNIGWNAFDRCSALEDVYITDIAKWCRISFGDNSANPLYYAHNLYLNGEKVTNLVIPDSVTNIGSFAFRDCSGLKSVTIPNSVTSIGGSAFEGCSGLTSVTIPDSVMSIGSSAFSGCSGLTSVTIPGSMTSIGEGAFSGCSGLTSVTIPDSVTSIGEGAFSGCSGLTSITLPFVGSRRGNSGTSDSLFGYIFGTSSYTGGKSTSQHYALLEYSSYYIPTALKTVTITDETVLGYGAFYDCSGLTSVTIPDSVTSIRDHAFYDCSRLAAVYITDIAKWCGISFGDSYANPLYYAHKLYKNGSLIRNLLIPDSVTSIGNRAFYGCELASVTIPSSVTSIGDRAFYGCDLASVTIPGSVASIGERAFYGCGSLTDVTILGGVTSIGKDAFYGCINVFRATVPGRRCGIPFDRVKSLVISDGTSWIGDSAFSDCTGLTSVTIPDSVIGIGDDAFYNCSGLTSVAIPDSVTSIGNRAFSGCSGLTRVTIGNGVTSIEQGTFIGCSGLQSITVLGDNPNYSSIDGMLFSKDGKTLLQGVNGNVTIPNDVTSIGNYAFSGRIRLESVAIPDSVTSIGNCAFNNCSGLTSVTIPNSVMSIGSSAFSGCSRLASVTIPGSVTSIGPWAFSGCSRLASVTIPDSVTSMSIGDYAFKGCSGLTSVTIPDSVTSIGSYAFENCSGLKCVTIPQSVCSTLRVFDSCSSITDIIISDSVTSIRSYAFYGCSGLTSVTIPDSVTNINESAFFGCTNLTSVYVSIGDVDRIKGFMRVMTGSGFDVSGISFIEVSRVAFVANAENVNAQGRYVTLGHEIGELPYLLRDGYLFAGWWTDPVDGTLITASTIVTGNLNCYAHWIPVSDTDPKWTIDADGVLTGVEDFNGCTDVVIPPGVTSIGNGAFSGCSRLTSVTIPYSVTSIGEGAFKDCAGLTTFIVDAANVKYKSVEGLLLSKDGTTLIAGVNKSEVVVPDSVTSIKPYAFSGCNKLASVTIPNSVTSIGSSAFSGCSELAEITLPFIGERRGGTGSTSLFGYIFGVLPYTGGIQTRQVYASNSSTSPYPDPYMYSAVYYIPSTLKKVTISDETVLGYGVFYGCSGLTSVTIPDSVTSIGERAFCGCSGLTSVTIPDSVTNIGDSAFSGCSGLESMTLPFVGNRRGDSGSSYALFGAIFGTSLYSGGKATKQYPSWTSSFSYTYYIPSSLKEVVITDETQFGYGAFYNCSGLTSVTIPDDVTSVGEKAFYGCSGLVSMTIPDSVTSIGSEAFYGCSGLKSVTIPDSVTSIGSEAFYGCSGLKSVTMTGNSPAIGSSAFFGVDSSCAAYLPRGNSTYSVADGKWYGLIVVYCDPVPAGSYTMTFDANGGIGGTTEMLDWGAALIAPTVTRTGYTFTGWSPGVPATVPAANVTYTAQWRVNQYTVTFDANGGMVGGIEGGALTTNGWKLVSMDDITEEYQSASIGNSASTSMSLTLTGPYDLTFSWKVSSESGYDYLRWYLDGTEKAKISGTGGTWQTVSVSVPSGEHTIQWTYSKDSGGTSGSDCGWVRVPKTTPHVTYGQAVGELPTPTRTGYTFDGWFTAASGGTQVSSSTVVTGDVTYYAHWAPCRYRVTFGKNGGAGGDDYVTATYGSAMPTPRTAPAKAGYVFEGYWTTLNAGGVQYYDGDMKSVRNWDKAAEATLWAKWRKTVAVKVTFGKNGGTGGDDSVTATYEAAMPTPRTAPKKAGYVFEGYWDTTKEGGRQYYDSEMKSVRKWDKTSATTLWAKWREAAVVKVTFGKNGGTGGDDYVTATEGQPMPTPRTAPKKAGYVFEGYWDTTKEGGKQYYDGSMKSVRNWDKTAAVMLWAKWSPARYKVTFGKNGGTGGDNYVTATTGQPMPTPRTAPKMTGWTFAGYWDSVKADANGNPLGKQYYDANMKGVRNWDKSGAVTLWAKWTVRVTLGKNGGTGGDSYVTVTYGQPFPKRTMPTKTGYTFGGYFVSSSRREGQCYNADGTGTASMAWKTGGTPTVWALWTAKGNTSGRYASARQKVATERDPPVSAVSGRPPYRDIYTGTLAGGKGEFTLEVGDGWAFVVVATESDAPVAAECEVIDCSDGEIVIVTEDGAVYRLVPDGE